MYNHNNPSSIIMPKARPAVRSSSSTTTNRSQPHGHSYIHRSTRIPARTPSGALTSAEKFRVFENRQIRNLPSNHATTLNARERYRDHVDKVLLTREQRCAKWDRDAQPSTVREKTVVVDQTKPNPLKNKFLHPVTGIYCVHLPAPPKTVTIRGTAAQCRTTINNLSTLAPKIHGSGKDAYYHVPRDSDFETKAVRYNLYHK